MIYHFILCPLTPSRGRGLRGTLRSRTKHQTVTGIPMIELAEERMKLWVVWILPNWNLFGSCDWIIGAF